MGECPQLKSHVARRWLCKFAGHVEVMPHEQGAPLRGGDRRMKRYLLLLGVVAVAALALPAVASAQSGHFVGTQTCSDIGTQVSCNGKVAGLGGTTFTITVSAQGTASVTCTNPA